jgi:2-dehydropantoate 2-reductase
MHLDALDGVFGRDRVMGGLCTITVTLNKQREVVQLLPMQSLIFGDRSGKSSERVRAIAEAFDTGKFNAQASENVMQDMWEKWVFLASLAASTCLMRASLGDVLASPGGRDFLVGVVGECSSIASARGFAPRAQFMERALSVLISEGSELVASMFRDIEARSLIEGDQVIGDPIARGDADGIPTPRLHVAYTHLKVYERRRSNLLMGV